MQTPLARLASSSFFVIVLCNAGGCPDDTSASFTDVGMPRAVRKDVYVVPLKDALGPENLCDPLWACTQHCAFDIEGTMIDQRCADAMAAATCEENAEEVPPWFDVCFPKCSDPPYMQCNDDGTVTFCSTRYYGIANPRWMTYSCSIVCADSARLGERPKFTCVETSQPAADELDACQCDDGE